MEYKYREDKTRRQVSWVAIGKVHTRYYKYSENETLPKRGELMDGVSGAYITSVSDAQEHGKPIGMMVVSAIQPLNYADDSVYSGSGTMEVRSSRMSGENESSTYTVKLYVSDSPVEAAGGETVTNDTETVPGLYFATKTVSTPRPLSDYTYSPSISSQNMPGHLAENHDLSFSRKTSVSVATSVSPLTVGAAGSGDFANYVVAVVQVDTSRYPGLEMLIVQYQQIRPAVGNSYSWRYTGWTPLWGSTTETHHSGDKRMESYFVTGGCNDGADVPEVGETVGSGNKFVITNVTEDRKSIPGLVFATLTYTRFRMLEGSTIELESTGSESETDKMRYAERLFVNDSATGIPDIGDFYQNRAGSSDSGITGRICTEIVEEQNILPGFTLYTCKYAAHLELASISSSTSEIVGSRSESNDGMNKAQRLYVTSDPSDSAIPELDDKEVFYGDTGNFARVLVSRVDSPDILPGRTLVTLSYAAPVAEESPVGWHSSYLVRQRRSKGNGIYQTTQCTYLMPNATAKEIVPEVVQGVKVLEGDQKLTSYDWQLDYLPGKARVILNYSTLTAQEWMMQNINKALVYRVPAVTSSSRILDLNGGILNGGSQTDPNVYFRVTGGENVRFYPKERVILRGIMDSTSLASHNGNAGKSNDSTLSNIGISSHTGIFMGVGFTPIAGTGYWEMEASFLVRPDESWNDQCWVVRWKREKSRVLYDENDASLGYYEGYVNVRQSTGAFMARLVETASFSAFDGLVS